MAGIGQSTFSINSNTTITPDSVSKVVDLDAMGMVDEIASAMVEFIATRYRYLVHFRLRNIDNEIL